MIVMLHDRFSWVAGKIEYENLKKLNLESPYDIATLMIMDPRPTLQIPP